MSYPKRRFWLDLNTQDQFTAIPFMPSSGAMMLFDFTVPLDPTLSLPVGLPPSPLGTTLGISRSAAPGRTAPLRSAPIEVDPIGNGLMTPTTALPSTNVFADFDLAGLNAVLALGSSAPASLAPASAGQANPTIEPNWVVVGL